MWNQVNDGQPVRAVVVDTDINLNYLKLTKAITFLKHPDCIFLVGGTETQIPITADFDILGKLSRLIIYKQMQTRNNV